MTHLETVALVDVAQTPPPLWRVGISPLLRVAPPARVKPLSLAPSLNQAQRTASGPFVETGSAAPRIEVDAGPLILVTTTGFQITTRLVRSPAIAIPPVA